MAISLSPDQIIILFITVINVFIVIFTGDSPPPQTVQPVT